MGFLLQISGLLTLLPIGIGLIYQEIDTVISLFIVCVTFLGLGFLMNALCERKDLDFKSANYLFLMAFVLLPLIGSIPYMYNDPFISPTLADRFTNSYFESVSGYTTTGFSFISAPETIDNSLLVYRSLTELMGGVGIVFLLLAFFQSRKAVSTLGSSVGVEGISGNMKRIFLSVFVIYGIYVIAFMVIFYAMGFQNPITTGAYVIDTMTGGYQPSDQMFQNYLSLGPQIATIALMIIGSINFVFHFNLFTFRPKKAITVEILAFFIIIAVGTAAVAYAANKPALDSLYHVVSMSSSTGYRYPAYADQNFPAAFGSTAFSILVVLMIIGGCAFSMAGGLRVSRIIGFFRTVKETIMGLLIRENAAPKEKIKPNSNGNGSMQNLSATVSILLMLSVLVIFALIFTTIGASFTDAIFEVGSALTTNGISLGYTTVTMGIGYKWLMIAAMTFGRVEILSIIIGLFLVFKRSSPQSPSETSEEPTEPTEETELIEPAENSSNP